MSESMKIEFDLGNAAFEGEHARQLEIYRILGDIREKVINGREDGIIKDVNGNTVGNWSFDPYEEPDDDAEYCTACCVKLEPSQIGKCDDCQDE